jgi:hypothetical protein
MGEASVTSRTGSGATDMRGCVPATARLLLFKLRITNYELRI